MLNKKTIKATLVTATTLSLLMACTTDQGQNPVGVTPTPVPEVSDQPSTPPTTSPKPEESKSPDPKPEESKSPDPKPEESKSPTPDESASPSPEDSASPSLNPVDVKDPSISDPTTFNGKIYDDTMAPLDGVTVKARSLNSSLPFEAETISVGGTYAFNNAPSGVQIEILANKEGFTTRRRVEVLKKNDKGDPNANKYDFGTDGTANGSGTASNALSDKPEVNVITPGRNASGVDPSTNFVLKFSEAMDKDSVEDTFAVRAFNSRKLTIDSGLTANTFTGSNDISNTTGSLIWDKNAFDISWNSDDTEVTFTFKEERTLPSDKDVNLVPDYQVLFGAGNNNRLIKDKSGISRSTNHFKLTDGPLEESFKFAMKTDEKDPGLSSVTAQTDENSGTNGDALSVKYSERMIIYSKSASLAGGKEMTAGSANKAPAGYPGAPAGSNISNTSGAAGNYTVTITSGSTQKFSGTWQSLGGTAVYDTNDATHKTVLLLPPTASGNFTAAGASANNDTLTGTAYYSDGSTAAFTATTAGTTYANLATSLNASEDGNNGWTVTETTNATTAGTVDAGDAFNMTLAAGSKPSANTAISYVAVQLNGGVNAANLGIAAGTPYWVYAGTAAGSRADLYDPGDTVKVEVASTVMDPAGNTLDTNDDDETVTAS